MQQDNSCFRFVDVPKNFSDASLDCSSNGGRLAEVNNKKLRKDMFDHAVGMYTVLKMQLLFPIIISMHINIITP